MAIKLLSETQFVAGLNIEPDYVNRIWRPTRAMPNLYSKNAASVVYVMTRDQRLTDNFSLAYAQQVALLHKLPLLVVFSFLPHMPNRAREHFDFMLQGLHELSENLTALNIPFIPLFGRHHETIQTLADQVKPFVIVTDFSPLSGMIAWQTKLGEQLPLVIVDTHNCVPVWQTSSKQEFSARTIRPKIHQHLQANILQSTHLKPHPFTWKFSYRKLNDCSAELRTIRFNYKPNNTFIRFSAGETSANKQLGRFIDNHLQGYATNRNDPNQGSLTELSPYLHFGSIGAISVVRKLYEVVAVNDELQVDVDALIEELVVRKELSDNYCYYNQNYGSLHGAPKWAQDTLNKHRDDQRDYLYSLEQFEQATTHDPAWNAAQIELTVTGKMHGYMRMYWAKKILEWSESPETAIAIALYLNDFYSIDGGDPNGYVGVLWSIAGLHDRPWGERPVYGTVRSMVYNGLKRKFDIAAYIQKQKQQHEKKQSNSFEPSL